MIEMKMVDDTPLPSERDLFKVYGVYNESNVLICIFFKEGLAEHYCRNYPYNYKEICMDCFGVK